MLFRKAMMVSVWVLIVTAVGPLVTPAHAQDINCDAGVQFLAPMDANFVGDGAVYRADVANFVADVEAYWGSTYPQTWSGSFTSPCVVEYEPATVPYQQTCGLTPEIAQSNAFYCRTAHAVMWDGPTFYQPLYAELGDKSVLFIIAHEYGHAVQFLSGQIPQRSVNRELQADCYAGAYIGYAEQRGLLEEGDYREIVAIVAAVGQSRFGTRWVDRTHGTAVQRELAMRRGYQGGVPACQVDFESLIEDGIERPLETLPPGENTVELPNGNAVTVTVPVEGAVGNEVEITGPRGNAVTVPVPSGTRVPRRPGAN